MLPVILFSLALAAVPAIETVGSPEGQGKLVVVNQGDHSVSVVDLRSGSVLGKVSVGVNGHEVEVSRDGHFAYVPIYSNVAVGQAGTNGDHVDIVDLREFKVVGHIDLGLGVRPHCAKLGSDGLLYVSAELDKSVYAVDLKSLKVVAKIPSEQSETHMFVVSKAGRAYTANISSGSVSVLDLKSHKLVTVIPISKSVQRISISPDGRTVFTHDQTQPRVVEIDTATNTVARSIMLPGIGFASAPTPDGRSLVVVCNGIGKVAVVDLKSEQVTKLFDMPSAPQAICVTPDGSFCYVSCIGSGKIAVLDLKAWALRQSIQLDSGVDGMSWIAR